VLGEVAARIQGSIRHTDLLVRWENDRFLLLCRGVDLVGAGALAKRIESAVTHPHLRFAHRPIPIDLAMAFVVAPQSRFRNADGFFAATSTALNRAKQAGRRGHIRIE
jgi:GGDEF domain-containing protein